MKTISLPYIFLRKQWLKIFVSTESLNFCFVSCAGQRKYVVNVPNSSIVLPRHSLPELFFKMKFKSATIDSDYLERGFAFIKACALNGRPCSGSKVSGKPIDKIGIPLFLLNKVSFFPVFSLIVLVVDFLFDSILLVIRFIVLTSLSFGFLTPKARAALNYFRIVFAINSVSLFCRILIQMIIKATPDPVFFSLIFSNHGKTIHTLSSYGNGGIRE